MFRWISALSLLVACSPPSPAPDAPADDARVIPTASFEVESGPAWIVFADKGPADASALEAAAERLHPATVARRERNRPDGSIVDVRDLPVHDAYVAAIEDLGLVVRVRSRRLNAVSVEDIGDLADVVAALPFVRTVRPVALKAHPELPELGPTPSAPRGDVPAASPFDYGTAAWQVEMVAADQLHGEGYTGAGVIVGVADTGFRLTHEVLAPLQPQVLDSYDFLEDDAEVANESVEEDDAEQDFHGSAVLSTLAGKLDGTMVGIAPDVSLLLAKTESVPLEAPFEEDTWIAGVEWAEAAGADLVTSSLAWADWYTFPEDLDGATAVSTLFANDIVETTGLLLIQSAGNDGPGESTIWVPNDAESVVAAAAVTDEGEVASFSSRGPTADGRIKPDLAAPGQSVTIVRWDEPTGLQTASGTSFAAPILAGVAALLVEAHPDWTREEIVDALKTTASLADAPDNDLGWGIVDGWEACGLLCTCRDEDGDGAFAPDCGGDDCDDADSTRFPGQEEACNAIDDDCDGVAGDDEVDEDADGDLLCATDCDDTDPALHGLDDDADGDSSCGTDCDDADPTVEGLDHDGDGVSLCGGDCADGDASVSPELDDVPYDGLDQDCDGVDLVDVDGDGFVGRGGGGTDCADTDPSVFPDPVPDDADADLPTEGGHELCFDGLDNDCDGLEGPDDPDCRFDALSADDGSSTAATTITTTTTTTCALDVAGQSGAGTGWLAALLLLFVRRRRSA